MIDEHGNTVSAADVDRVLRDSTFRAILEKVRSDQVAVFMNSAASDTEAREEAHAVIRALSKIEQAFKSVKDDEAIKLKRKGRS